MRERLYAHPVYLCEQGCDDLWLFFEAKKGPRAKRSVKLWDTLFPEIHNPQCKKAVDVTMLLFSRCFNFTAGVAVLTINRQYSTHLIL